MSIKFFDCDNRHACDRYLYLDGISGCFGHFRFSVIRIGNDGSKQRLTVRKEENQKQDCKKTAYTVLKIFSYFLILPPLIALIAKACYRKSTVFRERRPTTEGGGSAMPEPSAKANADDYIHALGLPGSGSSGVSSSDSKNFGLGSPIDQPGTTPTVIARTPVDPLLGPVPDPQPYDPINNAVRFDPKSHAAHARGAPGGAPFGGETVIRPAPSSSSSSPPPISGAAPRPPGYAKGLIAIHVEIYLKVYFEYLAKQYEDRFSFHDGGEGVFVTDNMVKDEAPRLIRDLPNHVVRAQHERDKKVWGNRNIAFYVSVPSDRSVIPVPGQRMPGGNHWALMFIDRQKYALPGQPAPEADAKGTIEHYDGMRDYGNFARIEEVFSARAKLMGYRFVRKITQPSLQDPSRHGPVCGYLTAFCLQRRLEDPNFAFSEISQKTADEVIFGSFREEVDNVIAQRIDALDPEVRAKFYFEVLENMAEAERARFYDRLRPQMPPDELALLNERLTRSGIRTLIALPSRPLTAVG